MVFFVLFSQPAGLVCKMEALLLYCSIHIAYTCLHVWRRLLHSVGAYHRNFGASELSQKLIKGPLLVGLASRVLTE